MFRFVRQNIGTAIFAAIVAVVINESWGFGKTIVLNANWGAVGDLFVSDAVFQASLVGIFVPAVFLWIYLHRFKFSFQTPEPVFRVVIGGQIIGFFSVLAIHVAIGDAAQLFREIQEYKYENAVRFCVAIYFIFEMVISVLLHGNGAATKR